jgi:hypothetical protein
MKKQVLFVSAVVLSLAFASCGGEEKAPVVEETSTTETTTTETEVTPATEEAPAVVEEKKVVKKETKKEPKQTAAEVAEGIVVTKGNVKKPTNATLEVKKIEEDYDLSILFFIYLVIFLEFHWFVFIES